MKNIKLVELINEVYNMDYTLEEFENILKDKAAITDPIEKIKLKLWYEYNIYKHMFDMDNHPCAETTNALNQMMPYIMQVNKICENALPEYIIEQEPTMKLQASEIKGDVKWLGILLRFILLWKWCAAGMDDNYKMYINPIIKDKLPDVYDEFKKLLDNNQHIREYNELIMNYIQEIAYKKDEYDRAYLLHTIQEYYTSTMSLF